MQNRISDEVAITFATHFYRVVGEGRTVEEAMSVARAAISITSDREWSVPVLYTRSRDGILFPMQGSAATSPEDEDTRIDPVPPATGGSPTPQERTKALERLSAKLAQENTTEADEASLAREIQTQWRELERDIAQQAENVEALHLSSMLSTLGRMHNVPGIPPDRATNRLNDAIRIATGAGAPTAELHGTRATLLAGDLEHEHALEAVDEAIALDPRDPSLHLQRVRIARALRRKQAEELQECPHQDCKSDRAPVEGFLPDGRREWLCPRCGREWSKQ
jgi:hypothetical protein